MSDERYRAPIPIFDASIPLELELVRRGFPTGSTEGDLYVGGELFCHTLEDVTRSPGAEKVWGKTAIPEGRYGIIVDHSPRFKQLMPRLLDVPGFTGIRIHWGNKAEDTEGCILVGEGQGALDDNWISNSKVAYRRLLARLLDAQNADRAIWITIRSEKKAKAA